MVPSQDLVPEDRPQLPRIDEQIPHGLQREQYRQKEEEDDHEERDEHYQQQGHDLTFVKGLCPVSILQRPRAGFDKLTKIPLKYVPPLHLIEVSSTGSTRTLARGRNYRGTKPARGRRGTLLPRQPPLPLEPFRRPVESRRRHRSLPQRWLRLPLPLRPLRGGVWLADHRHAALSRRDFHHASRRRAEFSPVGRQRLLLGDGRRPANRLRSSAGG